jgi:CDP-paratose 2-epimerase
MMKILITGGCGFVGSHLAMHLLKSGNSVTCMDNLSRRGSEVLLKRVTAAGASFVHGDVRNIEDLSRCASAEILIDCSAEPSVLVGSAGDDAWFVVNNNLIGSLNCFEWARKRDCGVLFMSTSRVYPYDIIGGANYVEEETRYRYADGLPGISERGVSEQCPLDGFRSLYGSTKLAAEFILKEYSINYDLPAVIDRCGVIAGPWQLGKVDQGVFTYWLLRHYFNKPLQYIGYEGKGKQVRDLLHVEDLCSLIDSQINRINDFRGDIFNAGGGMQSSLSLLETTAICQKLTGNRVDISPVPKGRPADLPWFVMDNAKTEKTFGWRPGKSAKDVLHDIHDWISENEQTISANIL